MKRPEYAHIEWRDGTPYSSETGDVYFTRYGGREEREHVFLRLNDVEASARRGVSQLSIAELGFGTGLNFFLTWRCWREHGIGRLHYVAFERSPIAPGDLRQIYELFPDLQPLVEEFLSVEPLLLAGCHRLVFDGGRVSLTLFYASLSEVTAEVHGTFDAWYLDGFSPATNPELWDRSTIEFVTKHSRNGTTASTYSVAGAVRRELEALHWAVEKVPGIGKKTEVLKATFTGSEFENEESPWFNVGRQPTPRSAIIIGAGISGMTAADALSARGIDVTVIDRADSFSEASGNRAAIFSPYISADADRRHQLFIRAFEFSRRYYSALAEKTEGLWDPCGVVFSPNQTRIAQLMSMTTALPSALTRSLSAVEAGGILGVRWNREAVHFPTGGCLFTKRLRAHFESHPSIRLVTDHVVEEAIFESGKWILTVRSSVGDRIHLMSDALIHAGGPFTGDFSQCCFLPLVPIWGETFSLAQSDSSQGLRAALVSGSYVTPAYHGSHTVGATNIRYEAPLERIVAHREKLQQSLIDFEPFLRSDYCSKNLVPAHLSARAATYDRLPYLGPVPDIKKFCNLYWDIRKGFPTSSYGPAPLHPGLFMNTGHGSRGFVSAPYAAEILASIICNEPLPIERSLLHHLLPARYPVRELRKPESPEFIEAVSHSR